MSANLSALAIHLTNALIPLRETLVDEVEFRRVMWRIGWDARSLPAGYAAIASTVDTAITAAVDLTDGTDLLEVLEILDAVGAAYRALSPLPEAPAGVEAGEFLATAGRRLFEYHLAEYLRNDLPGAYRLLEALGVIGTELMPAGAGRSAVLRTTFAWEALPGALLHLDRVPADVHGWGTDAFDAVRLAGIALNAAAGLGVFGSLDRVDPLFAAAIQNQPIRYGVTVYLSDTVSFGITELPADGGALPGVLIRPLLPPGGMEPIALGEQWTLSVAEGTDLSEELAIVLRPDEVGARYPYAPGRELPAGGFGVTLEYDPGSTGVLFGDPAGSRLELDRATASARLDAATAGAATAGQLGTDGLDLRLAVELAGLAMVLSPGGADSFLGHLLGEAALRVAVPFGLAWSSRTGLDVATGLGIAVSVTPDIDFGFARIDRVDIGALLADGADGAGSAGEPPSLSIFAAATFSGSLGPILYAVEGLGVELIAALADGNAGPFDLRMGVRFPTGLGIGVDAEGVVTGGGFLSLDPVAGRYAGVAELSMLGVGLTVVGIVETKLAGDPNGWSLFLSVIADFTPIQLGFGFTLNGVGGFMGLHRTLDADALGRGVREGRIDSLLFPTDPLANATRILADIEEFFPTRTGEHSFGVMAKFGWGTPTLVTAEIGVVLSVPDVVIAVLGELSTVLPAPELPLIELHMAVVGIIDLAGATLSVTASIYDSQLVGLSLAGDMAMYVSLGAQPYFLLSVGGYSDGWTPPSAVPSSMRDLRRMSAAIDLGAAFDVGIDTYVALTPNTLQFGAEVYASLSVHVLGVDFSASGEFGFDVQITFSPFEFVATMHAGVSIRVEDRPLCSVQLTLRLEGPEPWYGTGRAEFRFLGKDVPFQVEVGQSPAGEHATDVALWTDVLLPALQDLQAWTAAPAGAVADVTLRALDAVAETGLWLQPEGSVEVRQRLVPLNRPIGVYGALEPSGENQFDLVAGGLADGETGAWQAVAEYFAPAQYTPMTPAERLSAPSYELMDAGISLTPSGVVVPLDDADLASVVLGHEEAIIEGTATTVAVFKPLGARPLPWVPVRWPRTAAPNARYAIEYAQAALVVAPTRYTLVDGSDARVVAGFNGPYTYADAVLGRGAPSGDRPRIVPVASARPRIIIDRPELDPIDPFGGHR